MFRSLLTVSFGNGFLQACGLLMNVLLIRLLSGEQYGGFALIQSTVALVAVFFSAGLALATTRTVASIAKEPLRVAGLIKYLFRLTAVLSLLGGLLCVSLSGVLAARLFHHPELRFALAVSSLLVLANILNGIQVGAMQGLQAFGALNQTNILRGVVQVLLTSIGAWVGGLDAAVAAYAIAGLLGCAINRVQLRRILPLDGVTLPTRAELRALEFFKVMRSAMASQLINVPVPWLLNVILLRHPNGLQEVAYLNIARQIFQALTFVPEVMSQITLPRLTTAYTARDKQAFSTTLRTATAWQVAPVVMGILVLVMAVNPAAIFFKLEASVAHWLVWLVGAQAFLSVLSLPFGSILWATNQTGQAFVFAVMRAVVWLALAWCLRDYGVIGMLAAICLTLAGQFVIIVAPRMGVYFVRGWPEPQPCLEPSR